MRIALIVAVIAALVVFGCQNAVKQEVQMPPPAPDAGADAAAIEQTVSADDIEAIDQDLSDLDGLGSDLEPSEFEVDTQI